MRSIAIINQKGGVGKTTTAVNLSAALARAGRKTLLIDLDPQAHASLHLGIAHESSDRTIYQVLTDDLPFREIRTCVDANLWVAPAHIDLAAAEMELAGEVGREIILKQKLQQDTASFDYVIIDCPPSLGVLTLNALTTAREVLLPLQPHFLALHGLSKLMHTMNLVAERLNSALQMSGVMFCMYDRNTRLAGEVVRDVELFFDEKRATDPAWANARLFDARIRRNIRLAEAPSFGQSIFEYAPESNGASDYLLLAQEVIDQSRQMNRTHSGRGQAMPRGMAA